MRLRVVPLKTSVFSVFSAVASLSTALGFSATLNAQTPYLSATPMHPKPGGIVKLAIKDGELHGDSVVAVSGEMAGEALHLIRENSSTWHAIGAYPVDGADSVTARVVLRRRLGSADTLRVTLKPEPQKVAAGTRGRSLAVDSRFTRPLDSATAKRVEDENELARQVGRRSHDSAPMWTQAFLRPRASRITSGFGSGRVFNGSLTSRHLGVDFAGTSGSPIRAANRGVVALVDTFFLAGRVVYVDHGGGVVTGYFHMTRPLVLVGDTVARGQTIGLVGATGRVTGPHLHWTARYGALVVDPLDLVALGKNWYRKPGASDRSP